MPTLYGPPWVYRLAREGRLVDEEKGKRDARINAALTLPPPPPSPALIQKAHELAAPSFLSPSPAMLPSKPASPSPLPRIDIPPPLPADKPPGSFLGLPGEEVAPPPSGVPIS